MVLVTAPVPNAACTLRPTHVDLSTSTSESAVLMTLSNYGSDLSKIQDLLGSDSILICWDEALDVYQTTSSSAELDL